MTNIRMLSLVGIYLVIFIDNLGASLIIPMLKPIVHDLAAGLISEGSESFRNGVYGMALGAFSIAMFFVRLCWGPCPMAWAERRRCCCAYAVWP